MRIYNENIDRHLTIAVWMVYAIQYQSYFCFLLDLVNRHL